MEAIFGGAPRKIEAIRLVREAMGFGLKEAKEFVEKLSSELYTKAPHRFAASPTGKGGCVGVLVAVTVILGVAVVWVKMLI